MRLEEDRDFRDLRGPMAALCLGLGLALCACSSPEGSTSSSSGGSGGGGSGGSAGAGGQGGSAGGGGVAGSGGAPVDPECAVPPGASDLVHEGIPAEGLVCTRFPYPLASPRDVVETADGHVLVTEFGAGKIVELTDSGFVTVAEGLVAPIGLREAGDGALLVAEEGLQSVARIDRRTGARTPIAAVGQNVTYLALGPDGAGYVSSFKELADTKKGVVFRVDLTTAAVSPFATALNVPEGLFFDDAGELLVAEWLLPSAVHRLPAGGGAVGPGTLVAEGFQNVYGLAGDGDGGFYAGDHAGRVVHVAADGTQSDVVTGIGRPGGIWRAKNGDLWVAEFVDFGQTGYLIRISGL